MSTFTIVDPTDPAWAFDLAQRFLDAATACGWSCDRKFVADGQEVEAPPPGRCQCQIAAVVTPGVTQPQSDTGGPVCYPVFTAEIVIVVDLCVLMPNEQSIPKPDQVNTNAHANQTALWQIMQGLLSHRSSGALTGMSTDLAVGPWEQVGQSGGSARWQTRWSYRQ